MNASIAMQSARLNKALAQVETVMDVMKGVLDQSFGLCDLCGGSLVASIHDSNNPGSHWFARSERPGGGR